MKDTNKISEDNNIKYISSKSGRPVIPNQNDNQS